MENYHLITVEYVSVTGNRSVSADSWQEIAKNLEENKPRDDSALSEFKEIFESGFCGFKRVGYFSSISVFRVSGWLEYPDFSYMVQRWDGGIIGEYVDVEEITVPSFAYPVGASEQEIAWRKKQAIKIASEAFWKRKREQENRQEEKEFLLWANEFIKTHPPKGFQYYLNPSTSWMWFDVGGEFTHTVFCQFFDRRGGLQGGECTNPAANPSAASWEMAEKVYLSLAKGEIDIDSILMSAKRHKNKEEVDELRELLRRKKQEGKLPQTEFLRMQELGRKHWGWH